MESMAKLIKKKLYNEIVFEDSTGVFEFDDSPNDVELNFDNQNLTNSLIQELIIALTSLKTAKQVPSLSKTWDLCFLLTDTDRYCFDNKYLAILIRKRGIDLKYYDQMPEEKDGLYIFAECSETVRFNYREADYCVISKVKRSIESFLKIKKDDLYKMTSSEKNEVRAKIKKKIETLNIFILQHGGIYRKEQSVWRNSFVIRKNIEGYEIAIGFFYRISGIEVIYFKVKPFSIFDDFSDDLNTFITYDDSVVEQEVDKITVPKNWEFMMSNYDAFLRYIADTNKNIIKIRTYSFGKNINKTFQNILEELKYFLSWNE